MATTSKPFGTLPSTARGSEVSQYTIDVPPEDLDRMQTLLKLSNVASACYENSLPDGSRDLGIRRDWLLEAKERWEKKFDWRVHEQRINAYPNFRASIPAPGDSPKADDAKMSLHFVALFSQAPKATPVVLLHGWPGSFLEFLPILSLLQQKYPDPATLPYHVIVPSLPGYALSDAPPLHHDFRLEDAARAVDYLMVDVLGLRGYVAQGGDVGSRVARILGAKHEHCRAVHLNYSPVPQPPGTSLDDLDEVDKRGRDRHAWFMTHGMAYGQEQATKPATLGLVLSSNPLALLAWVGEKFLDWSDPASFPPDSSASAGQESYSTVLMDEILLSASLYYLSGHAHTNFFSYREAIALPGRAPLKSHDHPDYRIRAPKKFGYSYFPFEIAPMPRSWVETTGDLVYWNRHDKGGHFAALEQPDALLGDVEAFIGMLDA